MKKPFTTGLLTLIASAAALNATVTLTTGTSAYDSADQVLVASSAMDNALSTTSGGTQIDPMMVFQPSADISAESLVMLLKRVNTGVSQTFNLYDFGTTAPGGSNITLPGAALVSEGYATTVDLGPSDNVASLTWNFGSTINLVSTNYYAVMIDAVDGTAGLNFNYDSDNGIAQGGLYQFDGTNWDLTGGSAIPGANLDYGIALNAVPEPSTYALMLGFIALGGVLLRRRMRG
jgi:hypothetical protein